MQRWILLIGVTLGFLGMTVLPATVASAQVPLGSSEMQRLSGQLDQLDGAARKRAEAMLKQRGVVVPDTQTSEPVEAVDDRREVLRVGGPPMEAAPPKPEAPELRPFGRELFEGETGKFSGSSYGPVPADYRIGPGDELVVQVYGQVSFRDAYRVDREGRVLLREGGSVAVAGLSLRSAESRIRTTLSQVLGDDSRNSIDVSLGRLRAIRVFVVGEAARPGGYELSSAATLFEALYAAGGPNEVGSLRDIRLVRSNRIHSRLDLYRYLLEGSREGDAILRDGDTVFLPVAIQRVSIRGEVRRPAIYELAGNEGLADLLRFAGGARATARNDLIHVERLDARVDGRINLDLSLHHVGPHGAPLMDGDVLELRAISRRFEHYVDVGGAVARPGRYGFAPGMGVSDLLENAGGLLRDARREDAVLVRTYDDYRREAIPTALDFLGAGGEGPALAAMDSLHVYSVTKAQDDEFIIILGEVDKPGRYPWFEGMRVRDLLQSAGGTLDAAQKERVELSRHLGGGAGTDSLARVQLVSLDDETVLMATLVKRDMLLVRRQPGWEPQREVSVSGEVLYPGSYTLRHRDERLSEVLARAGGMLESAFLDGFSFTRQKDAIGFIGVELDRALRQRGSVHDVILEDGDRIHVPSRPMSVKVIGEVGFPTSVVYRPGMSIGDYVVRAGGRSENADAGRTHVIYPSGISRPVRRFWPDPEVIPGSTVVVPTHNREEGIDWGATLVGTTQILASLATAILVIDRVGN